MLKEEGGLTGERLIVLPRPMLDLMEDNPLTGDLYVHSLGHIAHASYHAVSRPEGCAEHIFIYCTCGRGEIRVGGRTFTLKDNRYVVLPAGIPHSYSADNSDPWSIYWIRFAGPKASIFARAMGEPATLLPSVSSRIDERTDLFERMYSLLCGGYTIDKLDHVNFIFGHFLSTFLHTDLMQEATAPQRKHAEGMVSMVTHYMNENLEKRLTLAQLASFAGFSESYFHRRFVAETGHSPIDYFIHMKINKAAIYLLKTTMSVSQIASKLGFNSANYFSRTFTSIVGIPASEFRKQNFRI